MNLFLRCTSDNIQKTILLLFALCLFLNTSLSAHGDLDIQIERISKRIEKDAGNANLYIKRGQLYAQHNEPKKSKQDYLFARNLDENLLITDLLLAQLFADNNEAEAALPFVNLFLKNHSNHSIALITRAKIYQQMRQPELCQKDLENALAHLAEPNPSHFISISEEIGAVKPSLKGFKLIEEKLNKDSYYYIGDNIKKDFIAPNKLNWKTICLVDNGKNIHSYKLNELKENCKPENYIFSLKKINVI